MGKKGKSSEADKAAKREEQEAERAVQAVLAICNKEEDIFTRFAAFKKRKAKDFEIHLTYFKRAQDMGKEVLAWAFDLTKKNMEAIYNATTDMKWNDKIKKSELSDATARYILLTRGPIDAASDAKADESKRVKISPSQCVGFVQIRFENEGGPTLYIYEFQLDKTIQRQGLGKFCVSLLELLAWKSDLDQVMLTVQQTNKEALAFYQKMKYTVHENDPGSSSYSLMAKARPASLAKTVPLPTAPSKRIQAEEDEEDDDFQIDEDEEDEGDDEGDEGDEVGLSKADVGESLRKMMAAEGPIVTVVIVEPDGSVVEEKVDMTPKKDTPGTILGGRSTFLGQYEENEEGNAGEGSVVTVMVRSETKGLPKNKCKLPPPLDKEAAYGRVLLIRMDEQAVPQNFTKAEFEALGKEPSSTTSSSATTTSSTSTTPSASSPPAALTEAVAEPTTVIHAAPVKKDQAVETPATKSTDVTGNIPDSTNEKKLMAASASPVKSDKKEQAKPLPKSQKKEAPKTQQNQPAEKAVEASSKKDRKTSSSRTTSQKDSEPAATAEVSTSESSAQTERQPETESTFAVAASALTNAAPEPAQKPKKKKIVLRKVVKPADSVDAPSQSTDGQSAGTTVVKKIVKKIVRRAEPSTTSN